MRRTLVVTTAVLSACLMVGGAVELAHAVRLRAYDGVEPICRVETSRRAVALTFDDGPDPRYTEDVLQLLADRGVPATFFVIGARAVAHPFVLGVMFAGGNEIANHTWSHQRLSDLSEPDALEQVREAERILPHFGGSRFVRAPYGDVRAETLADLWSVGLVPVHWSIPLDHFVGDSGLTPPQAARVIADEVKRGDIILAHDAADGGVERSQAMMTLRLLLPLLDAQGIEVTTVGDLLREGTPVSAVPRPWIWQSGFSCPDG